MPVSSVILPEGDIAIRPDTGAGVAQLFAQHQPELFRYCRSILRDPHDAEDVVQITMLKAMLHAPPADGELRPWLYRVAHNEAISMLRARLPVEPLDDAAPAAPGELAQTVEHRVRLAAVHGDLHDLTERQRVALVLREYSGCSHEQIAGRLGVTPRAVKQLIFEARTALHVCEEGRELVCADVRSMLTGSDGRVLRGRRVRAHLRACRGCRLFRREVRHSAVAPFLPFLVAGGIFTRAWASVKGTVAGWAGGSAGSVVGTKLAVSVAVVASAGGVAVVQPELGSSPAMPGAGFVAAAPGAAHSLAPGHSPLRLAGGPAPAPALRGTSTGSGRAHAAAAHDAAGVRAPRGGSTPAPPAGTVPAPGDRPATAAQGSTSDQERGVDATVRDPRGESPPAAQPVAPGKTEGADPAPPASAGPPADAPGQSGAAPGQSGAAPGRTTPPAAPPADPGPPADTPAAPPAEPPAGAKAQGDPGPPPSAGQPGPPPGPSGGTPGHGSRK